MRREGGVVEHICTHTYIWWRVYGEGSWGSRTYMYTHIHMVEGSWGGKLG